jgi:hypothetical protein
MSRSLAATVVLGIIGLGANFGLADVQQPQMSRGQGMMQGGHQGGHHRGHHRGDYLPWQGQGFGGYAVGGPSPSQAPQVYDLAPAVAQAAFADAQYDNRWVGLQVMLERARGDFYIAGDYLAARKDLVDAQRAYDSASDEVLSRLANDQKYRELIEQRTERQIALQSAGVGTGLRNVVADEKLRYGAMASHMEAFALANDSAVQDARKRLVAAQDALTMKERLFESQLYNRPEIVAARQSMEMARADKAGANGYLHGAEVTRADQIDANYQSYGGNTIVLSPYYRGYFGIGY